jgi:tetratricopeptide (TPR) repeat protein
LFSIFLFIILFFLSSCTNKKNTVITRNYHNLTSRFNGLFNANEAFKEGVKKLNTSLKEDYDHILPVYNYGTQQDARNISPEMDKCYKKASSVIERHSIFIKGKEYCKWIDETYLLIGKSHLYKHDYFLAIEAFDFVANQFKKLPTAYEAKIWKIRTLIEIGNLSAAEDLIDEIKTDKKFPKKLFAEELAAAEADLYIRQKNNAPAISWLKKALKYTKSKENKIRYNYILAQLYKEQGDNKKALTHYEQVLKLHPKYEMTFYAKLNKARVMEANSKNAKTVKKELIKMAKDDKNDEYKDQIYYTLAEINIKEENFNEAVENLKLSIKESKNNQKQKGKSNLLLADLYYEKNDYVKAQQYYDSATTFLPKDFYGYEIIENKKNNLGKLVAYLDTIKTEDSLLQLTKLSEKEIQKIIDKEIDKRIKEYYNLKKAAKEAEQKLKNNENKPASTLNENPFGTGGAWYFYNPTTITFGINEFNKKWGNRKLEDNWRRSNKPITSQGADTAKAAEVVLTEEELDKLAIEKIKEPTQYLNKIPKDEQSVLQSENKIANAYYNLGVIYTQLLNNTEKGAEAFETLIERFPNHPDKLTIYYQLYRIYINTGETKKAEKYKNLLISADPSGEYAQLINNPNYATNNNAPKSKIAQLYEETYSNYQNRNYQTVIETCNNVLKTYSNHYLLPKFDYLKALSVGKTQGIEAFERLLKEIVLKYPGDPIREEAQNLLNIINSNKKNGQTIEITSNTSPNSSNDLDSTATANVLPFTIKDTIHYYLMIYPKNMKEASTLSNKVSEFNDTFFSLLNLSISTITFGDNFSILVRTFENKVKALDYYNTIKNNTGVFNGYDLSVIKQIVINPQNLQMLLNGSSINDYQSFFNKQYLSIQN